MVNFAPDHAERFDVDMPEGAPTSSQERAYTSPLWFTLKGQTSLQQSSF